MNSYSGQVWQGRKSTLGKALRSERITVKALKRGRWLYVPVVSGRGVTEASYSVAVTPGAVARP